MEKKSLCYPDRHRRTDRQVVMSTVRAMGVTLIGAMVAAGALFAKLR